MTGKWKPKPKKVVETSLGKAPKDSENVPDVSHLRQPISTSIHNMKQIIALFQTATTEVQDYITYECDILYECRTCRTIFRSLANFILHKRKYCKDKIQFKNETGDIQGGFVVSDDVKTSDEDSRCPTPTDVKDKKGILPIIDKLLKKQQVQILAKETVSEELVQNSDDEVIFISEDNSVALQKIEGSEAAVFQTSVKDPGKGEQNELMKAEVLEIHGILDRQAVLGTNGKICNFSTNKLANPNIPKPNLTCPECNFTFSTVKTLTHHIKYKHNKSCIVYPCPDCKEPFSNAWSVYRHLYKVHRRTSSQVRRMRHLVHSSRIRKDQEPEKRKQKLAVEDENAENQWMNNFEGDKDLQMCGGCGKRFERKAALHSHSVMCTKRIAVCNSIKNAKGAKKEKVEENVEIKVKGAAKRKQKLPIVMHSVTIADTPKQLDPIPESTELIITKHHEPDSCPDVTITKEPVETDPLGDVPEVEIFTISDESNDDETQENIADEYKEYVYDEEDRFFFLEAMKHIDRTDRKCVPCETTFLTSYMLLRHMSLHFSWFRFQCSKCSFVSFHKYDCTAHAYSKHGTLIDLIDSTVLPIPKWKVLCTSHGFKELSEDADGDEMMPRLEAVDVTDVKIHEEGEMAEMIILEDDEMPDICTEYSDTVVLSDDEKKDIVINDEKKKVKKAGPSTLSRRPVRNRTQSYKTLQNDFIYDLGVKFDHSRRNTRLKK